MSTALLPVRGMFCPECPSRLRAALQQVPGVRNVVIDLGARSLSPLLLALEQNTSRQSIAEAIEAAGFTVATENLENGSRS